MADVQKTIEIIFGATDKTGSGIQSVGSNISALESKIGGVTQPLSDLADKIYKLDAAILAAGAALVGFSVNEAGKFGDAVNEINSLLDITPEQFGEFSNQILEYSRSSSQSIENINGAVYSAISAGVDYEASLGALAQAEKLSIAGKADLNSTTVLLASTLNAYGASTEEAGRYSDAFFKTVQLGQTTLPELASRLSQVTGIAASAGIPIETLTAAVADLTAKGLPTAQAITGIKAAISNIIKPTKDAEEAAADLGIQFDANALQTKGFEGLMLDLAVATGGNTEQMSMFFGSVEGLNAALSLTRGGAVDFIDKLEQMRNAAGATEVAYAKMAENFTLINQNLKNNVKATLIDIGEKLLPQYKETAESLAGVFASIGDSVDEGDFAPLFDVLNSMGDDVAAWMDQLAANLPAAMDGVDWSGLTEALTELGLEIGGLFDGFDVSDPEKLGDAIQEIIDSGESLVRITKGMIGELRTFIYEAVIPAIKAFNDLSDGTKESGGQIIQWGQIINGLLPVVSGLGGAIETLGWAIGALAFSNIIKGSTLGGEALAGLAANVKNVLPLLGKAGLVGATGAAAYGFGTILNEGITKVISTMTGTENSWGTWIYELINETDGVSDAVLGIVPGVNILNETVDKLSGSGDKASRSVKELDGAVTSSTTNLNKYGQAAETVGTALKETGEGSSEAGQAVRDFDQEVADYFATQNGGTEVMQRINALLAEYGQQIDLQTGKVTSLHQVNEKSAESQQKWQVTVKDGVTTFSDLTEGLGNYEVASKDANKATEESTGKLTDAQKAAEAYKIKMEELASNERIATIEAVVDMNVAQIEADAQRAVAAFDSIASSISSTNDLIGDLFSHEAPDWDRFGFETEEQIKSAEERANKLTDAQVKLLNAEAERMEAQAEQLRDGGAVIKIEADGLEPEIEAFMWKLLERIQLRAIGDASDFLLAL